MNIVHQGLNYRWHPNAFLTRCQAEYALSQLWQRCAEGRQWVGPPVIEVPAADRRSVLADFEVPAGELPWVEIDELLPAGVRHGFDTSRLPAMCRMKMPVHFRGRSDFPLDLVALTYLMLTRWEETALPSVADRWGNYQAAQSLAHRQGFLDRPVLDEWAQILGRWLKVFAPCWPAQRRPSRVFLTHDIDHVTKFRSTTSIMRESLKTIVQQRSICRACQATVHGSRSRINPELDPYHRGVEQLLQFDEQLGIAGTFFFMAADPGPFDDGYDINSKVVRDQMERVVTRGHEIGWHPSYRAADDAAQFFLEKRRIDEATGTTVRTARHHYLRWRSGVSWQRMAEAGLKRDSSLGYNEAVGFRCGTARPFWTWDDQAKRTLPLEESPLIVEDITLLQFLRLDWQRSQDCLRRLRDRVRQVGGDLTILIHNSQSRPLPEVLKIFQLALH